jgi:hypothetical protein
MVIEFSVSELMKFIRRKELEHYEVATSPTRTRGRYTLENQYRAEGAAKAYDEIIAWLLDIDTR